MGELTPEQGRERHHAYMRGWQTAASLQNPDSASTRHADSAIRDAYNTGYQDGITVRRAAVRFAALTYGFGR